MVGFGVFFFSTRREALKIDVCCCREKMEFLEALAFEEAGCSFNWLQDVSLGDIRPLASATVFCFHSTYHWRLTRLSNFYRAYEILAK